MPPPRPRSIVGPVILIGLGVLFLMRNMGYSLGFLQGFGRYWPLLLVLIGVVRLVEWAMARSSGRPAPCMGGGSVFLLILVIIAGCSVTAMNHAPGVFHFNPNADGLDAGDEWMHLFGNEYTFDGEQTAPLPAGNAVHVRCDRGNVTVNTWDQPQVRLSFHKRVFEARARPKRWTTPRLPSWCSRATALKCRATRRATDRRAWPWTWFCMCPPRPTWTSTARMAM
jgi:hypothetical protein